MVRARPLHKRILLHPFSIMVILCAGVLIAGSTFPSFADSYDVTATVPAPLITSPAVITSPIAGQHFSSPAVAVAGTCQAQSYVKLNLNSAFAGVSLCTSGVFTIPVTLLSGANQLQAQIYNLTDQAGPASFILTAYYDQTVAAPPPPPSTVPTTLEVSGVENSTYTQGEVQQASDNPTITGTAPPYSTIVVTFHSVVTTCTTIADGNGWWSCTLDHDLPIGVHHVDITAVTTSGQHMTFPTFQISVLASLANLLTPATTMAPSIQTNYQYQARRVGQPFTWDMNIAGGQPPYSLSVEWGDGTTTRSTQPDRSTFTLSHPYKVAKEYVVTITAVDAAGSIARLQLVAVVNHLAPVTAGTVIGGTPMSSLLGSIRQRLWLIWPAYIVVVLMVIGYWLGEREEYQQLMLGRRPARRAIVRTSRVK